MSDPNIIGVDDDQFGVARKAESFAERLWQRLSGGRLDGRNSKKEEAGEKDSFLGGILA